VHRALDLTDALQWIDGAADIVRATTRSIAPVSRSMTTSCAAYPNAEWMTGFSTPARSSSSVDAILARIVDADPTVVRARGPTCVGDCARAHQRPREPVV